MLYLLYKTRLKKRWDLKNKIVNVFSPQILSQGKKRDREEKCLIFCYCKNQLTPTRRSVTSIHLGHVSRYFHLWGFFFLTSKKLFFFLYSYRFLFKYILFLGFLFVFIYKILIRNKLPSQHEKLSIQHYTVFYRLVFFWLFNKYWQDKCQFIPLM